MMKLMAMGERKRIERTGIGDIFYETRVLRGREFTLQRFAAELLGATVDPVMLGYIEKGQRFPNPSLVRRLAAVRGDDPRQLLAILARDRMLKAVGTEITRLLEAPGAVRGADDAELAVRVSMAVAALPDDNSWIPLSRWRKEYRQAPRRQKNAKELDETMASKVEQVLISEGLIELDDGKVRRSGRHYVPKETEERKALALQYALMFFKGLLDELAFPKEDTGTYYLRNHYLNIDKDRLPEFKRRLDDSLRELAEEFAGESSDDTEFLNVLATATSL